VIPTVTVAKTELMRRSLLNVRQHLLTEIKTLWGASAMNINNTFVEAKTTDM